MVLENKIIKASGEQLQLALQCSPIGMALVTLTGEWHRVNSHLCNMLGYSNEELLQTNFQSITHPDDIHISNARLAELVKGTIHCFQQEKRYIRKDKEIIWVMLFVSIVHNNKGAPDFFITQVQDVTESKKIKQELEKRDRILQNISERVPGMIYQFRLYPDGKNSFPYCSNGIKEIFELEPGELETNGAPAFERIHPEDLEALNESILYSAKNMVLWQYDFRTVLPENGIKWVRGQSHPEKLEDGSILWHGYLTDITKSKEVEETLRKKEQHLQLLMEVTQQAIWDWDLNANKKTYSDRWFEMLGYDAQQTYNQEDWKDRIHKEDISRIYMDSEAHINGQTEFYETVFRVQHQNGSWLYILDRGKVVERDKEYKPLRFSGTHTNITKEKMAEQKAIEVSHAKSFFMANMSHEIRTPVHGIAGMASLLADTSLTEQQKEYVNTIKESGDGLLVVINDILDFSKIEAGKMEISAENFDLHDFIKGVASLFYERIIQKRLLFNVTIEEGTPKFIRADKNRLRQILSNLLNNALKFTDKGSISFCVKAFYISTLKQPKIMFSVSDTGIGIKSENVAKIFDRFSQEDNSISRKYGGTGLGLSISKSLINLMDGDMELNSEPGSGSTFSFYIGYHPVILKQKITEPINSIPLKSLSILVADDNMVNCMVIKKMIETIGHSPTIVNNGKQALVQMEHQTFDLIFMDLHMPVMDGLEATQKIIEQYKTGRPKIIAITADAYEETKVTCLKIGMDDFLAKPFAKKDLADIILKASA